MQGEWHEIYQHRHDIRRYIQRTSGGIHDPDDIIQDVFLKFHAQGRKDCVDKPASYLISMARNLLIDRSRQSNALKNSISIAEVGDNILAVDPEQEQSRRYSDLKYAYEAALAELSPRCREVFVLRRHDEVGTNEAAEQFGISPRMVQKYMARATVHLEERLSAFTNRTPSGRAGPVATRRRAPLYVQFSDLV